jgi:hypothetical protein
MCRLEAGLSAGHPSGLSTAEHSMISGLSLCRRLSMKVGVGHAGGAASKMPAPSATT